MGGRAAPIKLGGCQRAEGAELGGRESGAPMEPLEDHVAASVPHALALHAPHP